MANLIYFTLGVFTVLFILIVLNIGAVLSQSFRRGYQAVLCNFEGLDPPSQGAA